MTANCNNLPQVTFVLPSYKQARTIGACLDSILRQKTNIPFEICIADSSNDETTEWLYALAQRDSRVRLVCFPDRRVAGAQRNAAISAAKSDWILAVDTDCVLPEGLLESLWHAKSLDGLEILAPAILNGNTKSWLGTVNYWTEFGEFSPHEKPRANAFVPGACLFFAKSIVTRWGGFPEIHRIEDLLGIHHWIKSGARTRFLPNLGVFHVCTGQLKESIVLQWNLGMWSARARKLSQLSDSFLVRAFWLWPFLGGLRFMRVSRRWLRNPDWSMRARYLALLPLTVGSLSIWNAAFIYGSLTSYEG